MEDTPNVYFITPVFERFALTEICLEQRRRMIDALPFQANAVVIGDDANLEVAERLGFQTVEMDNKYVGRKFNIGYHAAKRQGATHCMAIGSDSWLHPSALADVEWDRRAVGLSGLSSFSPDGQERIDLMIKYAAGFGVGMVYPEWCLLREPCSPSKNKGCDNSTWSRCGRGKVQITFQEMRLYTYLNFHSTDVQITDWKHIKSSYRSRNQGAAMESGTSVLHGLYDADLVERLEGLYASRAVGVLFSGREPDDPWAPEWSNRKMPKNRGRRNMLPAEARKLREEKLARERAARKDKIVPNTEEISVDRFRAIIGRNELGGR